MVPLDPDLRAWEAPDLTFRTMEHWHAVTVSNSKVCRDLKHAAVMCEPVYESCCVIPYFLFLQLNPPIDFRIVPMSCSVILHPTLCQLCHPTLLNKLPVMQEFIGMSKKQKRQLGSLRENFNQQRNQHTQQQESICISLRQVRPLMPPPLPLLPLHYSTFGPLPFGPLTSPVVACALLPSPFWPSHYTRCAPPPPPPGGACPPLDPQRPQRSHSKQALKAMNMQAEYPSMPDLSPAILSGLISLATECSD